MYLKYGSYEHGTGECSVNISREGVFPQGTHRSSTLHRWEISGMLTGSGTDDLTTKIRALEQAYSKDGYDIGLYKSDGNATANILRSRDTVNGTRVTRGVSYPDGTGAQYATIRSYAITVEGETLNSSTALKVAGWFESINVQGTGGQDWGYIETLTGVPQKQIFRQSTIIKVVQSGEAIGIGSYPVHATPLWPANEHQPSRNIVYVRPSLGSTDRITQWTYTFLFDKTINSPFPNNPY